jgi:hypothetical protein
VSFQNLDITPGMLHGTLIHHIEFSAENDPVPQRYVDFFNERMVVVAAGRRFPYYETRSPSP